MSPSPIRFLVVVAGPSAVTWLVGLAVIVYGVYIARLTPDVYGQVLAIALFLQLFAASTGFRAPLGAGHFDALLVGSPNRWKVAAAHWAVSIGPGALVWVVLAVIELVANPRHMPGAVAPAAVVLLAYASTVVWAISVVAGRLAGALIWLALLFALNASGSMAWFHLAFVPKPDTLAGLARSTASVLVVPVSLVLDPGAVGFGVLALVTLAAALAWLAGATAILRAEAALAQP